MLTVCQTLFQSFWSIHLFNTHSNPTCCKSMLLPISVNMSFHLVHFHQIEYSVDKGWWQSHLATFSQGTEQSFPGPHRLPHMEGFQKPKVCTGHRDDDDGPRGGLTLTKSQHSKTMLLMLQFPAWNAPHSWALAVRADGKTHPGLRTERLWGWTCTDGVGSRRSTVSGDSAHTGQTKRGALSKSPSTMSLFHASVPSAWNPIRKHCCLPTPLFQ